MRIEYTLPKVRARRLRVEAAAPEPAAIGSRPRRVACLLAGEELFYTHVRLHGGPAPLRRYLPELIKLDCTAVVHRPITLCYQVKRKREIKNLSRVGSRKIRRSEAS